MRLWPRRHGTSYDLLVAGLGNPGREYAGNRHNVGFMVADELARRHGGAWKSKFNAQLADVRIDGHKVVLLKPQTYMNDSGRPVSSAMRFYKLEPASVLVVHDETDLPLGRLQARRGGGLAGHNGLRSVAQHLGTPDFLRLRIGVGRPERATGDRSPTTCWPTSSRTRTRTGSSPTRRTRWSSSTPRASTPLSARSTASARNTTHTARLLSLVTRKPAPPG